MLHEALLAGSPLKRVTVLRGQVRVSQNPAVEFSTVLGSCIATCLFDPEAQIGGMNHFLLAEPPAGYAADDIDVHYGVNLMELLINKMLVCGAVKRRMRAHLYGGANMYAGMAAIGTANAIFARSFLEREGIPLVREDVQGNGARWIDFRPSSGQVRCRIVENTLAPTAKPANRRDRRSGDVELF